MVCAGAVVLLGWCVGPVPGAGAAGSADAWSVAPSAGAGAGARAAGGGGRPCFYLEGTPGAVLKDTVAVTNPGTGPRTVTLRGAGPGGTGKWLAFTEREVTVPPRTRAEVPFTATVPRDAAPGDHLGEVVARGGGRDERVPVRLRVSGPALAALTVERVRVDAAAGRISYDLVNRGNTVLEPRIAVRAEGLFGELLDRKARKLPLQLAPGRRVSLTEPWGSVPALDSVDVRLTVTAAGGVRERGDASARLVPWPAVGGGAAGALALTAGGVVAVRRRRRAEASGEG